MYAKMKPIIATILFITCCIIATLYSFFQNDFFMIFLIFFILVFTYVMFQNKKMKLRNDMVQISNMIDNMIKDEETTITMLHEDILASKLQHQILRLQTLYHQQQDNVRKDRDEIRLLINDIAHQMRTPLANLQLFLELLESEPMNNAQRNYIDNIEKSVQSVSFLSESFIKMSRIEGKVIQLKLIEQSFTKTVQEAIDQCTDTAIPKNIKISFDVQNQHSIIHDRQWMREAISNVIDNAIKYSNDNGFVCIHILSNDMFLQLQIEDTGIGIQKEEEHLIFQRFYRGKLTNDREGFGLGLYISRNILLKHNGFIKVKTKDTGCIFTIVLPR